MVDIEILVRNITNDCCIFLSYMDLLLYIIQHAIRQAVKCKVEEMTCKYM